MIEKKNRTLIYCIDENKNILLGLKKKGFGVGKLNGYGGKQESDETIEEAAIRELKEESTLIGKLENLYKVAEIEFYFKDIPKEEHWDQKVHIYLLHQWEGMPKETEEMKPEWHHYDNLPLKKMWIDDEYWLYDALDKNKLKATFIFEGNGDKIHSYEIKYVDNFNK